MALELRCPTHPKYEAKRKPTADCKDCRALWVLGGNNKFWESFASESDERKDINLRDRLVMIVAAIASSAEEW